MVAFFAFHSLTTGRIFGEHFNPECKIRPLGIVINLFRRGVSLHGDIIHELQVRPEYPKVFEARIPLTVRAGEIFDPERKPRRLAEKYPSDLGRALEAYVNEIVSNAQELSKNPGQAA